MKQEWMDKPVLCIFDTRQIQTFMFRANSYFDTLGGSDLMLHILNDAISSALKTVDPPLGDDEFDLSDDPEGEIPFFTSERIKFQLIICTAGNALLRMLGRDTPACGGQHRDAAVQQRVHQHEHQGELPHDQHGVRLHLPDLPQKPPGGLLQFLFRRVGRNRREGEVDHIPVGPGRAKLLLRPVFMGDDWKD